MNPVHDRGRVLVDTEVRIADGGRVLSDLAALHGQIELPGPVASDSTLWRALEAMAQISANGSRPSEPGSAGKCGR